LGFRAPEVVFGDRGFPSTRGRLVPGHCALPHGRRPESEPVLTRRQLRGRLHDVLGSMAWHSNRF
jgi:hypothetical protein